MKAFNFGVKPYPAVSVYLNMSMDTGRDVYGVVALISSSDRVAPPSLNLSIRVKLYVNCSETSSLPGAATPERLSWTPLDNWQQRPAASAFGESDKHNPASSRTIETVLFIK